MEKDEKEGKTIMEYLGVDSNKYMGLLKKIAFFITAGFISGVIVDTVLGTEMFATILPLSMILFLLFKWYKQQ